LFFTVFAALLLAARYKSGVVSVDNQWLKSGDVNLRISTKKVSVFFVDAVNR